MDQDRTPSTPVTKKDKAYATNKLSREKESHTGEKSAVEEPGSRGLPGNIMTEMAKIYQADRQNSLRVRRDQGHNRRLADSSDFVALEDLLLVHCDPTPEEVVENILRDFCSSPTYVEDEDEPPCESEPWFRFRRKRIKTYCKRRVPKEEELPAVVENEEQDRLSCSSGLSVQEDLNTTSLSVVCDMDVNTSQKIRENLQNLSQYFSLSSTGSNPKIDLPSKARRDSEKPSCSRELQNGLSDTNSSAECTNTEMQSLKDDLLENGFTFEASQICDIKPQAPGSMGDTLFGDIRQPTTISHSQLDIKCEEWSEADSFLEDYNTEKMSLDVEDSKPNVNQLKTETAALKVENEDISVLDDIPISEWLVEMDVPDKSLEETKKSAQEIVKLGLNSQTVLKGGENSDKPIEVSKEMQNRAAKLLADLEAGETHQQEQDSKDVGFRTASNKAIKITEEMEKKGAMFLAQFKATDQTDHDHEDINSSDFVGFKTASNKPIEMTEEMERKGAMFIAQFKATVQTKQGHEDSNSSDFVGFKTASNKAIKMTEEMERKGAMFIAQFKTTEQPSQSKDEAFLEDIAFSEWQPIDFPDVPSTSIKLTVTQKAKEIELPEKKTPSKTQSKTIPQLVGFRKTPYKFLEVPEEMRIMGDKLIAEVESGLYQPSQRRSSHTQAYSGNNSQVMGSTEFVGFKTASNKPIEISEEMKRKAAQLIAEVEAAEVSQPSTTVHKETGNESEFAGFRTASNKPIVISEEMKNKAAKLMAEVAGGETIKKILSCDDQQTNGSVLKESPAEGTTQFIGFLTASNKRIEISEEMRNKAAKLMEDVQKATPMEISENHEKSSNSSDQVSVEELLGFETNDDLYFSRDENTNDSIFPRLSQRTQNNLDCKNDSSVITPKRRRDTSDGIPSSKRRHRERKSPEQNPPQGSRQLTKTKSCQSELGTPPQSQEIHASLSQLAGLSPLDQSTKTSVIARRNLLSLSKLRKKSSTAAGTSAGTTITPAKPRFAPMPASTSTPLADRNSNQAKDSKSLRQNAEDMSPICMPPNKTRKLGLSRSRY
ncbi:breast cancer type 2 susceptibility protein homolog [Drosophila biarmipes]|uniref:breast cancer type 2 susceptibility protein homolog n=1 Tax=Drosophila biarmipes TaxID=125945 RepID=UPI001CDA6548|nr:breast cancer type 2 susceptibility protein homolog [Drosophila biarmipes]XP_043947740.1 breast cancer type 2 susceptibility protein homolog [Drosophila biarmipes]XP_050743185.1 breast cancer type 2 susceptibility protein homolog [Drosophila biarmipes]